MILLSDISILSAHDINSNLLHDFYKKIYLGHRKQKIWKWLNRSSFYDNKIPLVIVYKDHVIGHAGMIPFNVFLDGVQYTASWFIDFALLPAFKKRGLGTVLVKKWMEFSDIFLAAPCNKQSIRVFKKCGWEKSFDADIHHYYFKPFDHPKLSSSIPVFLRRILNKASCLFFQNIYNKYALSIDRVHLDYVNRSSLGMLKSTLDTSSTDTIVPIRDKDYMSWRLLDSPDRNDYRVFSIEGIEEVKAIIKICKKYHPYSIDILWISNLSKLSVVRNLVATIGIWSMKMGYSYIRYHAFGRKLSDYLKETLKPIRNRSVFAFYAKDIELFNKLKISKWHWELIDSDFERFF